MYVACAQQLSVQPELGTLRASTTTARLPMAGTALHLAPHHTLVLIPMQTKTRLPHGWCVDAIGAGPHQILNLISILGPLDQKEAPIPQPPSTFPVAGIPANVHASFDAMKRTLACSHGCVWHHTQP